MLKEIQQSSIFERLIFLSISCGYLFSFILTSVDRKFLLVPIILILTYKFIKKQSFLSLKINPINLTLFLFIPAIIDIVILQEYDQIKSYWIHSHNYHYLLFAFAFSFLSLDFLRNITSKSHAWITSLFSFSFILELVITLAGKLSNPASLLECNLAASTSNPNIWGTQIALLALLVFISHKEMNTWLRNLTIPALTIGSILSSSTTAILAFALAASSISFAWIPANGILFIALFFSVYLILLCPKLLNNQEALHQIFGAKSSKFLPRIRLWGQMQERLLTNDFNALIGLGHNGYITWVKPLLKRSVDHLHNIFLHYGFSYGLIGLGAYIKHILSLFNQNKHTKALAIFLIISSCFDASFLNFEAQFIYWLILPLFIHSNQNQG